MAPPRGSKGSGNNLLSSESYDDDASTLRNSSEEDERRPLAQNLEAINRGVSQEYEEEHRRIFDGLDDDELVVHHNEVNMDDRDVLDSEDEREKLLSVAKDDASIFGSLGRKKGRRVLVGSMRDSYRMEEGSAKKVKVYDVDRETARRPTVIKLAVFTLALTAFLVALIGGAMQYSSSSSGFSKSILSNGTHEYHPTTILISLDGFRADFLKRGLSPTLQKFIDEGVSPPYMYPSFPSVTFPNHWSIVTGLYPESHGIVGNSFWDPELEKEFFYTDPDRSLQPHWWGGEPLWSTAERQGVKAAVHMWPGSEVKPAPYEISYLDHFNKSEPLTVKVDRIMDWLDKPIDMRPQFIASYFHHVDTAGHKYGPNSTEVNNSIKLIDGMLAHLFSDIAERNLTNVVNIVIVSDHGMATTSNDRLIFLDDIIDMKQIEFSDGWPLYGLRPKSGINMTALYEILAKEAANSPNWDVFLRDVDMPERWHFSKNPRIAPLWIVPKTGWAIVTRPEHDPSKTNKPYNPRGLHGYDNMHPLMRSIFIARGPAFPHPPGSKVEPFGNWEVYSIICHSLGLQQSPIGNNGTLSWGTPNGGFKFTSSKEEDVHDFPAEASVTTAAPSVPSESFKPTTSLDDNEKAILSHISEAKSIQADEPVTETVVPTTHPRPTVDIPASASGVVPTDAPKVDRPAVVDDSTGNKTEAEKQAEAEKHGFKSWLEYMKDKAKAITQKISDWWKNFWGA
ncbi:hypothetical protein TWF225_007669 [Orbilia oligospora]|uniref:Uncharacterized protein n=1 Tax=Orbilia oligospora TaxID=2813651 RepID=A0A7C8P128_ORBOL|nr:hypothetical protein TWF751_001133 [Orbilia oligospora]KAF3179136.1 hypothetical protein TWF225_007669 [Orbilia oligospora]KAF3233479.1 hypothetical protein TWF128_002982 [Orbilia oligospora]KAF3246813.1 hypothetical protein TWF217_009835 [Orbilia oligospora]KAF3275153.1 hypothetical protein TWF132_002970 [Orbilia oligospora]